MVYPFSKADIPSLLLNFTNALWNSSGHLGAFGMIIVVIVIIYLAYKLFKGVIVPLIILVIVGSGFLTSYILGVIADIGIIYAIVMMLFKLNITWSGKQGEGNVMIALGKWTRKQGWYAVLLYVLIILIAVWVILWVVGV